MPLSRSPRTDRRRRTMRENLSVYADGSDEARVSPSRTARNAELPELTKKERGVAYSHSVRGACQQRVVQFIPVRKISLAGAVAASAAIPLLLIVLHYLVFVSGTLDWSGHPMSALLNANSPRSLAAWMGSHLWLLCLGTTVLTFRLRKHKLDDYDGEYRLWFWLVFTCLIGSVDSTTRLTELFGAALDRWSQVHVGWSGLAITSATLATLIGLLGLRLCSELKAVPTSLVLWLTGLMLWAGSAALSQSIFHLDMSTATRSWLRASLWLSGLTCVWLCSLFYLRATFMEAQKRFLSRAMASSNSVPWRERLREAMPKLPRFGRARSEETTDEIEEATTKRKRKTRPVIDDDNDDEQSEQTRPGERREATRPVAQAAAAATGAKAPERDDQQRQPAKRGWGFGLGKLALRPPTSSAATGPSATENRTAENRTADSPRSQSAQDAEVDREYGKKSGWFGRRKEVAKSDEQDNEQRATRTTKSRSDNGSEEKATNKRSLRDRFTWKRKELSEEQIAARDAKKAARQKTREKASDDPNNDGQASKTKRSWLRMPKPKLPKMSLPKPKFPKLKLPSFRLPPPAQNSDEPANTSRTQVPKMDTSRPLPGTSNQRPGADHDQDQDQDDNYRNLSKAERKRLKRMQREDEGDRRAA